MKFPKSLIFTPALFAGLVLALTLTAYHDRSPVKLESAESKTAEGELIINQITWRSENGKDIWQMKQSHHGPAPKEWEQLQITVDNKNKTVDFNQAGGFRVSCFLCHSNGPRAIRPNINSSIAKISPWDRLKLFTWNLKIKSYGPMNTQNKFDVHPLRFAHPLANVTLNVKTCTRCHNGKSALGRAPLTRQNFMAIKFMIENKIMPPWPFSIDENERGEIEKFIAM